MTLLASPLSSSDPVPPHDLEAERAVLGAMLLDADAAGSAVNLLGESDFYRTSHRKIFKAISSLYNKNVPPDELLLRDELGRTGELEEIGGAEALRELGRDVTSAAFVEHHCGILREKATLRNLIATTQEILRECYGAAHSVDEVLGMAESQVLRIGESRSGGSIEPIDSIMGETLDELRALASGAGTLGVQTGYADLDRTLGGLDRGEFIVLAARPSVGKTTLGLNICRHVAPKFPVMLFSLEMNAMQICRNLLSMESGVSFHNTEKGQFLDPNNWDAVERAAEELRKYKLFIDDAGTLTVSQLRSRSRRYQKKREIQLIVVDYLQLLSSPTAAKESRNLEIGDISRNLKALAKELEIPVLVLAQLRRDAEGVRPRLSHLRESGSIEQDADKVVFIHREDESASAPDVHNVLEIIVAKNRNGPTGTVKLTFLPEILRFEPHAVAEYGYD